MEDELEENNKEKKEENKRPDLSKLASMGCDWQCSVDGGTC